MSSSIKVGVVSLQLLHSGVLLRKETVTQFSLLVSSTTRVKLFLQTELIKSDIQALPLFLKVMAFNTFKHHYVSQQAQSF